MIIDGCLEMGKIEVMGGRRSSSTKALSKMPVPVPEPDGAETRTNSRPSFSVFDVCSVTEKVEKEGVGLGKGLGVGLGLGVGVGLGVGLGGFGIGIASGVVLGSAFT